MRRLMWALLLALLLSSETPQAWGVTEGSEEVNDVILAVLSRQAKVGSFRYHVTCQHRYTAGGRRIAQTPAGDPPAADLALRYSNGLLRVDMNGYASSPTGWLWTPQSATISKNLTMRLHAEQGRGLVGPMGGTVRSDPRASPLLQAHLLFSPLSRVDAQDVRLAGRAEHDGHPCAVIERRQHKLEQDYRDEWWLAVDMDYSVVMWRSHVNGGLVHEATIHYEPDAQVGWKVSTYRNVALDDTSKSVMYTIDNQVTGCEFGLTLDPSEMRVLFPPGTVVQDVFRKTEYVVGAGSEDQTYSLLDQGRMEEFVERARQEVGGRFEWESPPARWPWYAAGGVLLLATAGGGAFYWRRRRHRRR